MSFSVTNTVTNTSTGNQTITAPSGSLGGATPAAVWLILTRTTADETESPSIVVCIGMTDGTRHRTIASSSQDNIGSSQCVRRDTSNTTILRLLNVNGSVAADATFVSLTAEAITINWASAPSSAFNFTAIFIGGTGVEARVDSVSTGNQNVATDVTTPGFQPNLVFFPSNLAATFGVDSFLTIIGMASDQISSGCMGMFISDNQASAEVTSRRADNRVAMPNGFGLGKLEISDFDAQGFSLTPRDQSANGITFFCAVKTGGRAVHYSNEIPPVAAGAYSVTSMSFKPGFVLMASHRVVNNNQSLSDDPAGVQAISAFTVDTQSCHSWREDDAAATMDNGCSWADKAIFARNFDGSVAWDGTLTSFNEDGFTLDIDSTTTGRFMILAVEADEEEVVAEDQEVDLDVETTLPADYQDIYASIGNRKISFTKITYSGEPSTVSLPQAAGVDTNITVLPYDINQTVPIFDLVELSSSESKLTLVEGSPGEYLIVAVHSEI